MTIIITRFTNIFLKSRKGSSYHPGVETITTLRALFANPLVSLVRLVMRFVFTQWQVITVFHAHNGKPRQATGTVQHALADFRAIFGPAVHGFSGSWGKQLAAADDINDMFEAPYQ